MALGAGKYDDECTLAREKAEAEGIILIVFNGKKGNGFSCQAPLDVLLRLPSVLRDLADTIERDNQGAYL
jgi:hypothetical protein